MRCICYVNLGVLFITPSVGCHYSSSSVQNVAVLIIVPIIGSPGWVLVRRRQPLTTLLILVTHYMTRSRLVKVIATLYSNEDVLKASWKNFRFLIGVLNFYPYPAWRAFFGQTFICITTSWQILQWRTQSLTTLRDTTMNLHVKYTAQHPWPFTLYSPTMNHVVGFTVVVGAPAFFGRSTVLNQHQSTSRTQENTSQD